MNPNDVVAISPATAALLAQVIPVFLLVFAIESGKLMGLIRSGLRRSLVNFLRLLTVGAQLVSIAACVVVVQLNQPMFPIAGVGVWSTFFVSLVFLYLLINAAVSREMLAFMNTWLTEREKTFESKTR